MLKSRYRKVPKTLIGKLMTHTASLQKHFYGVLKSFNAAHPEWSIPQDRRWSSLTKRLEGTVRTHFHNILIDRVILDWLEQHREEWPELSKLRGGLRKVISEEMAKRGDI